MLSFRTEHRTGRMAPVILLLATGVGACGGAGGSAQEYFERGSEYCASGEWRACEIELKNALQADPEFAAARGLLGEAYLRQGKIPDAAIAFEKAAQAGDESPGVALGLARVGVLQNEHQQVLDTLQAEGFAAPAEQAQAHLIRGDAMLGLGEARPALEAFRTAQRLDQTLLDAWVGEARAAAALKDPATAHRALDAVLGVDPKHAMAGLTKGQLLLGEGKAGEAEGYYRTLVAMSAEGSATIATNLAHYGLAESLVRQQKYEELKSSLDDLATKQPRNYVAKYFLAVAETELKNYEAARDLLKRGLQIEPTHRPSIYLYGIVNYALGNYALADEYLSKVVDQLGAQAPGRKLLALSELQLGKHEELAATVAPAMQGQTGEALWPLLAARAAMGMGQLEQGQDILESAVRSQPDDIAVRAQLGLSLLQSGEPERALAEFEAITAKNPDIDPRIHLLKFNAQVRAGRFDAALQTLAGLKKKHPDEPYMDYLRADVLLARGDVAGARELLRGLIGTHPDYAPSYHALANLESRAGDREAAFAALQALLARTPDSQRALLHTAELHLTGGDAAKALEWIEKARTAHPDSALAELVLAQTMVHQQRFGEAREAAERALKKGPDDRQVLELLAQLDSRDGRHADALSRLDKVAAAHPNRLRTKVMIARAHIALGQHAAARELVAELREERPDDPTLRSMQFQIELGEGNPAKALALAEQLAADARHAPLGNLLLGRYYARARQWPAAVRHYASTFAARPTSPVLLEYTHVLLLSGDAGKALELLEQSRGQDPGDPQVLFRLGQMYQADGREALARERYEALLAVNPQHGPALNNLAWISMERDPATAVEYAERALALNDIPEFRDTLGWILVQTKGDLKRAIELLQAAVAELPDNPEVRWHYAVALKESGLVQQAIAQLERLLKAPGEFADREQAQELLQRLKPAAQGPRDALPGGQRPALVAAGIGARSA